MGRGLAGGCGSYGCGLNYFNPFIPALVWREEKREKEMECSTVSSVAAASINQQETLEEENLGPQPIVKLEVFKGVDKSYFLLIFILIG